MNVKKAFKFTIILLIWLLAVFLFGCQQEPSLWRHQFGSGDDDIIQSIALDGLGNIYIAGMTFGSLSGQPSRGSSDAFIRKYDSSGNELWARQFGTAFMDSAEDIAIDKYNNVYLVGYTYNATSSQSYVSIDAFIRKYDGSGNELWTRQFGFGNEDHAYGVAIADNDSIYVIGDTYTLSVEKPYLSNYDATISKFDRSGNQLWTRVFGDTYRDVPNSITIDRHGGIYIAGQMESDIPGYQNAFISKFSDTGYEIWLKKFDSNFDSAAIDIIHDGLSSLYLAGYANGGLSDNFSPLGHDAFLRKYDESGNEVWTRQFGSDGIEYAEGIAVDDLKNPYVVGYTNGALFEQVALGDVDGFIVKYSSTGDRLWTRQFGTGSGDSASCIAVETTDENYYIYVVGRTYGTLPGLTRSGAADGFVLQLWEREDRKLKAKLAQEELSDIQTAVNMGAFPDITSIAGSDDKLRDPVGDYYAFGLDKDGYVIYGHDFIGDGTMAGLINYYRFQYTNFYYTVDSQGIVSLWVTAKRIQPSVKVIIDNTKIVPFYLVLTNPHKKAKLKFKKESIIWLKEQ